MRESLGSGFLVSLPDVDRDADHAVVGGDLLRRLAVQGDRQERVPEHERADRLLRPVQLLGGPGLPRAPAPADLAVPAPLRPRAGASDRAAGPVRQRARSPRARNARGGYSAQRLRSGRCATRSTSRRSNCCICRFPPRSSCRRSRPSTPSSGGSATASPAFMLAIFTDRLHWSAQRVSIVNVVFIAAWVMTAVVARRRYARYAAPEHSPAASRCPEAVRPGPRPVDHGPARGPAGLGRREGGSLRPGRLRGLAGPPGAPERARPARPRGARGAPTRDRDARCGRRSLGPAARRADAGRSRRRGALGRAPLPVPSRSRRPAEADPGARRIPGRVRDLRDHRLPRALGRRRASPGGAHADGSV